MAACGSLQHIFQKPLPEPLPENPTLLESLSNWNHQIKPTKPPIQDSSSFTEIFGELHYKENNPESSFPPSSNKNEKIAKNPPPDYFSIINRQQFHPNKNSTDSFSSMNSESLQLCTEGLGFESSADVEELKSDVRIDDDWENQEGGKIKVAAKQNFLHENSFVSGELMRRGSKSGEEFPPPISCIGESGKPWVCFKSYRQNGRFVLKEIRVPNQEFLHARREDGRLKLQFFQAEDEILEEEQEEEAAAAPAEDDDDDESDGIVEEEEEEDDDDDDDDDAGENDVQMNTGY